MNDIQNRDLAEYIAVRGVIHEDHARLWVATGHVSQMIADALVEMSIQGADSTTLTAMIGGLVYRADGPEAARTFWEQVDAIYGRTVLYANPAFAEERQRFRKFS